MDLYTITDLIDYAFDNEYSFDAERTELTLIVKGCGDSIDYANPHAFDGWEEHCMIVQDLEPFEDDETCEDLDDGITPMRTHGYKSIIKEYTLALPPNRKRGDTYTKEQIQAMVIRDEFIGDDIPGMGFSYYNTTEEMEEIM